MKNKIEFIMSTLTLSLKRLNTDKKMTQIILRNTEYTLNKMIDVHVNASYNFMKQSTEKEIDNDTKISIQSVELNIPPDFFYTDADLVAGRRDDGIILS